MSLINTLHTLLKQSLPNLHGARLNRKRGQVTLRTKSNLTPFHPVATPIPETSPQLTTRTASVTCSNKTSHAPVGNLLTRTDARGKTANYSYDSLNRISQIAYDDQTVNYTWDTCANGINRLCILANNNSSASYSYDSHGRISAKKTKLKAQPQPR